MIRFLHVAAVIAVLSASGCGGKPDADSLQDSFAQQLASNRFVEDFRRSGEELFFTGPGLKDGTAMWRVHFDSALIEPNIHPQMPYKGVVKTSWYADDQIVLPVGQVSHLPWELMSTGLAQDCWALWDNATGKWTWE